MKNNEVLVNEKANLDEKITYNANEFEMLSPGDLLRRYVLVKYEEKPYPGIVVDVDKSEVYVELAPSWKKSQRLLFLLAKSCKGYLLVRNGKCPRCNSRARIKES